MPRHKRGDPPGETGGENPEDLGISGGEVSETPAPNAPQQPEAFVEFPEETPEAARKKPSEGSKKELAAPPAAVKQPTATGRRLKGITERPKEKKQFQLIREQTKKAFAEEVAGTVDEERGLGDIIERRVLGDYGLPDSIRALQKGTAPQDELLLAARVVGSMKREMKQVAEQIGEHITDKFARQTAAKTGWEKGVAESKGIPTLMSRETSRVVSEVEPLIEAEVAKRLKLTPDKLKDLIGRADRISEEEAA